MISKDGAREFVKSRYCYSPANMCYIFPTFTIYYYTNICVSVYMCKLKENNRRTNSDHPDNY